MIGEVSWIPKKKTIVGLFNPLCSHLFCGQVDAHGNECETEEAVAGGEDHLEDLQSGEVTTKRAARHIVTETWENKRKEKIYKVIYLKTNIFPEAHTELEQRYVPIYLPMVVRVT